MKPAAPCVIPPVRRWAQLFVSVGKLNAEYNDSQIHNNLEELARSLQTLLYRVRLLFTKPAEGAVFHILNLRHIVAVARASYESPIRTLLSSEVRRPPSRSISQSSRPAGPPASCEARLQTARLSMSATLRRRAPRTRPPSRLAAHAQSLTWAPSRVSMSNCDPAYDMRAVQVLPSNSGGLGADAMAICKTLERDLDIVQAQYKEECLTSHVKELAAYVAKAQALLQAGRTAEQLAASVGDAAKARVRTGCTLTRACLELDASLSLSLRSPAHAHRQALTLRCVPILRSAGRGVTSVSSASEIRCCVGPCRRSRKTSRTGGGRWWASSSAR